MRKMIAGLILLGLLPTLVAARTAETKVDEVTVIGTPRRVPTASSPTTYGAPAARAADPGLPPERTIEPTGVAAAPTAAVATERTPGTPGRTETGSWPWKWFLAIGAVGLVYYATK